MTIPIHIVVVVEGYGDEAAVRVLIPRICGENFEQWDVTIKPIRTTEAVIKQKSDELANYLDQAADNRKQSGRPGFILILADAEDDGDCSAVLGPKIRDIARDARSDHDIDVVLVVREYESWFLAAAESLRGPGGFSDDAVCIPETESPRDAKGRIKKLLRRSYSERLDQVDLSALLDLNLAQANSASFARLVRKIEGQVARIRGGDAPA